jgi:hypothetical protein
MRVGTGMLCGFNRETPNAVVSGNAVRNALLREPVQNSIHSYTVNPLAATNLGVDFAVG